MNHQKDWTVMFYLAGDNDLSADMAHAVATLREAAAKHRNVNVLAYFDGVSPDVPTMYIDLSAPAEEMFHPAATISERLYPAAPNGFREDSSEAHSVVNFIDWCVNGAGDEHAGNGRRANRYALVLSGHSAGFLNFGMLRDETSERHMSISRLGWLLDRITQSAPELAADFGSEQDLRRRKGWPELSPADAARECEVILGQKLSILAFDSCLMGMLETAEEFASAAEILIASEGRIPNAGWNYAKLVELLASASDPDTARPASEFVLATVEEQHQRGIGGLSIDLAAWNLRGLGSINRGLADLASGLTGVFGDRGHPLYGSLRSAVQQAHIGCQTYLFEQNVDLGDFCGQLRAELSEFTDDPAANRIVNACDEVIGAIRETIAASGFAGPEYQFSNGVALFFPWSVDALRTADDSYRSLRFIRQTDAGRRWLAFLELYVGQVTRRQGRILVEPLVQSPTLPSGPALRLTAETGSRVPSNPVYRVPSNPVYRVPSNPAYRVPSNPAYRVPSNPAYRVPSNPVYRVPSNPAYRVPSNPAYRVPSNPVYRGASPAVGFSSFGVIKNFDSDWNVCGFRTSAAIGPWDEPKDGSEPRE